MRYPGSKLGAGVWQRIVSMMPPHDRYIEPFLGGGAVYYAKKPARYSIVADRDEGLVRYHIVMGGEVSSRNTSFLVADALQLLPSLKLTRQDLVYVDPPYHPDTRVKLDLYNFELSCDRHSSLLAILEALPCMVMLSGYRCEAYDDVLRTWHREDYRAMTRGGARTESVWCNFEPGREFHDTRYLGDGFRERERIKRKRDRWVSRFSAMTAAERAVIREALLVADGEGGKQ